jgi:hypothetical protein
MHIVHGEGILMQPEKSKKINGRFEKHGKIN